jgi:hypothetical protein
MVDDHTELTHKDRKNSARSTADVLIMRNDSESALPVRVTRPLRMPRTCVVYAPNSTSRRGTRRRSR